jgi:ABC-type glycerol-3-phosphate transport system substrate-binding protein
MAEEDAKTGVSRRAFLRTASVAAFGVVAAACGGTAGSGSGGSKATGSLSWWPGWTGTYMPQVAKAFEKAHPGVNVQVGNFYPTGEKLLTAIAGGNAPDVVADMNYYNFIARDLVVAMDSMIAASSAISLSDPDIAAPHWEAFEWNGKHYGIPCVDVWGREGMGYNVTLVQAAGLDINHPPQDWDETFAWHKELTKFTSSGNLSVLGIDPAGDRAGAMTYGDPWLWPEAYGFHYFNHADFKYDIDREETVEFLQTILNFYNFVGASKITGLSNTMQTFKGGAFGDGRQAMDVNWQSMPASVYDTLPKDNFVFTWTPVSPARKGKKLQSVAGHASMILDSSKNKKTAFALAEFLTEKTACDIMFKGTGWFSPRASWVKSVDLSQYPKQVQENQLFYVNSIHESDDLWIVDKDPNDEFLQNTWNSVISEVEHQSMTPKAAATYLQQKMTQEMATERSNFKLGPAKG